ncbi:MAG: ABC transporter permease [Planctomycetes bacterium]|nr:ABC transporter permease [Planctomycetota bacterium]
MRARVLREVGAMALRDYLRTPDAVFWTYGFPLIMALVLGLAFGERGAQPSRVAVVAGAEVLHAQLEPVAGDAVQIEIDTAERAQRRLVLGSIDAVLSGSLDAPVVTIDPSRPDAELAELRLESALRRARGELADAVQPRIESVDEPGGRYIDFLLPGLIGINLMGAGIYGVGYNVVQMRVKNLLRRIWVTPVGRVEFLVAFLSSRLLLALLPPFVILAFGMLAFGVPVAPGAWAAIAVLVLAGAAAFSGFGLLLASRARTLETLSGLMNVVMLPMWLCGGAFFSNDRFPAVLQPLVRALPLTWLTDGLRSAMLGATDVLAAWPATALLLAFAAATTTLAGRLFRWA